MTRRKLTIGVTGLNAIDSPGPGMAVIKGLKESPKFEARIIGLAYETLEPGIYMHDLVDRSYQIPYPSIGHETLLSRLEYIHSKEKLDVIIPNFDAELITFIRLQPTLKALGIHMFLPTFEQFESRHKGNLSEFGENLDIKVPKNIVTINLHELKEGLSELGFPVFVKGKLYDAYMAKNEGEAINYFHKISAKWGTPVILQQYIQGQELNVTALGDGKGNLIGAVPMRKTYITDAGKGWAGISIDEETLLEMTLNVVSNTKWAGGLELECIKENDTGDLYLIEINPRFPAWVYLAVGCGQNHPEALVRMALGEKVTPFEKYDVGKMFIRYSNDMICDLKDFEAISMYGEA